MAAPVKLPKGYGPKLGLGSFASSFASGLGRGMDAATRQREEEEERKAREAEASESKRRYDLLRSDAASRFDIRAVERAQERTIRTRAAEEASKANERAETRSEERLRLARESAERTGRTADMDVQVKAARAAMVPIQTQIRKASEVARRAKEMEESAQERGGFDADVGIWLSDPDGQWAAEANKHRQAIEAAAEEQVSLYEELAEAGRITNEIMRSGSSAGTRSPQQQPGQAPPVEPGRLQPASDQRTMPTMPTVETTTTSSSAAQAPTPEDRPRAPRAPLSGSTRQNVMRWADQTRAALLSQPGITTQEANDLEKIMLGAMAGESGGDPTIASAVDPDSHGLFQMNRQGGEGAGYSVEDLRLPGVQFAHMTPVFLRAYREARAAGKTGHGLVRETIKRAERSVSQEGHMAKYGELFGEEASAPTPQPMQQQAPESRALDVAKKMAAPKTAPEQAGTGGLTLGDIGGAAKTGMEYLGKALNVPGGIARRVLMGPGTWDPEDAAEVTKQRSALRMDDPSLSDIRPIETTLDLASQVGGAGAELTKGTLMGMVPGDIGEQGRQKLKNLFTGEAGDLGTKYLPEAMELTNPLSYAPIPPVGKAMAKGAKALPVLGPAIEGLGSVAGRAVTKLNAGAARRGLQRTAREAAEAAEGVLARDKTAVMPRPGTPGGPPVTRNVPLNPFGERPATMSRAELLASPLPRPVDPGWSTQQLSTLDLPTGAETFSALPTIPPGEIPAGVLARSLRSPAGLPSPNPRPPLGKIEGMRVPPRDRSEITTQFLQRDTFSGRAPRAAPLEEATTQRFAPAKEDLVGDLFPPRREDLVGDLFPPRRGLPLPAEGLVAPPKLPPLARDLAAPPRGTIPLPPPQSSLAVRGPRAMVPVSTTPGGLPLGNPMVVEYAQRFGVDLTDPAVAGAVRGGMIQLDRIFEQRLGPAGMAELRRYVASRGP